MKGKQIRQITDGAVVVAIYGLIFLLSRFTGGQLEYYLAFLMPLPLAIFAYKYDLKVSLVPFVASIVVSFLLCINPLNVLVFNIPYLIIGWLLGGLFIKKDVKPIYAILLIAIISAISEVLGTVVLSNFLGIDNIFVDIKNFVVELEEFLKVNNGHFVIIQALLEGIIPSIIFVLSLMNSLVTYLLFIILLNRLFKYNSSSNISTFFSLNNLIPKWISIVYVFIFVSSIVSISFFSSSEGVLRVMFVILINVSLIFGAVYIYFGIKVFSLFIRYIEKKWLIAVEFILLVVAFPAFIVLGLLDNFFSLQRKIADKIINKN